MEEDVDLMDFAWFNIELVQYDNDKNNFFLTIIPNMAGGPSDAVKVVYRLTRNDCLNILEEIKGYEDDMSPSHKICRIEEGRDDSEGDEPDPQMDMTLDGEKSYCELTFLNKKELKQFANLITEELEIEIDEDFSS